MADIEVDPYDLSDEQAEEVDRLVLRDELARTIDPEAFEDHPIEKRSSIAAIQWAARRYVAIEAAGKVMPWLVVHDREVSAVAWAEGGAFAYWQERGYDSRSDIPDHLVEELTETWNPYSRLNSSVSDDEAPDLPTTEGEQS